MARIGKYVVTGELGRGAHTTVFGALDPDIGRQVAIKQIRKGEPQSEAALERLRRQLQAAGVLNHPHIVAVYDYGEDAATAWMAMEAVQGKSLREHLAAGYKPAAGEIPELLVQVLEALDYAHSRGVSHGELTSARILVNESGAAKVTGFGRAEAKDEGADLRAGAALVLEALGGEAPPPVRAVLDKAGAYAGVRPLLEALKPAFRAKGLTAKLGALRRGIKATAPAADAVKAPRRLPAVLFVDDEERVLNALAALFSGIYDVVTATSAAAALERLRERRFLVIVSDQRMPGMTGVELLQQAKALAPASVRLLLTGYADLQATVGSINEGEVFSYLSKPWDQEDLKATLAEAVEVAIALEAAEARGTAVTGSASAALILGEPALARAARELAGGKLRVLEAADDGAALDLLAKEDVGVMVCDLHAGADRAALLRRAKRKSPQTQLVALSDATDAQQIIALINEARIYRLVRKPVNLSLLQQAIAAGLDRHGRVQRTPGLAQLLASAVRWIAGRPARR